MYNGLIIVLTILAFTSLLLSPFTKTKMTKMIFIGISLLLFTGLAIASINISIPRCSNLVMNATQINGTDYFSYENVCNIQQYNDQAATWFFASFALLMGLFMFIIGLSNMDDLGTTKEE